MLPLCWGAGLSSLCRIQFSITFLGSLPQPLRYSQVPPWARVVPLFSSGRPSVLLSIPGAGMVCFTPGSRSTAQSLAFPVLSCTSFVRSTDVCFAHLHVGRCVDTGETAVIGTEKPVPVMELIIPVGRQGAHPQSSLSG